MPSLANRDVPHADFAALVCHASEEHVRVLIYNFRSEPLRAGMRLWRLRPGTYDVRCGPSEGGEGLYRWAPPRSFSLADRAGPCELVIPPRREFAVDLRLVSPAELPSALPDPALGPPDVTVSEGRIEVTVHNLGSAPARDLCVALLDAEGREIARLACDLPACAGLLPSTVGV